jgi:RNA polymerase-binding transcription factor DksA
MTAIDHRRKQLQTRLADLTARLAGIESELDQPGSKDWEDLAVERGDDQVLEGVGLSGQQEIRMIEAALSRISSGDYGVCMQCGTDISEARLDVLPFTPFCSTCAAQIAGKRHV